MRDFDIERKSRAVGDRTFRIGGQEFRYRSSVAPEALLRWTAFTSRTERASAHREAAAAALVARRAAAAVPAERERLENDPAANADYQAEIATLSETVARCTDDLGQAEQDADVVSLLDETIRSLIVPDDHEKWAYVRDVENEEPLTISDLQDLLAWLIESVVNRPTGRSSGSSSRPESTGKISTAEFSLPEEPVSAS